MAKKLPVIIRDTREKNPWLFDADPEIDSVIVKKLDVGDYSIEGLERIVAIERKAGADELYTNFGNAASRQRFRREMDRSKGIKYRFIIIEQDLETLLNPASYYVNQRRTNKFVPSMPPAVVVKELIDIALEYDVHVIFAGRKAQSYAKRILLKVYKHHVGNPKVSPPQDDN
jgi:ERCC4-type nuclease